MAFQKGRGGREELTSLGPLLAYTLYRVYRRSPGEVLARTTMNMLGKKQEIFPKGVTQCGVFIRHGRNYCKAH